MSYSFEELLYEHHVVIEQKKARIEQVEQEADKIEEAREQAQTNWADLMEKEDEEKDKVNKDPTKDPENIKWMEEQIAKDKELFGEDFGEDVKIDFNNNGAEET